jgi:type II secretory pathway component PulM
MSGLTERVAALSSRERLLLAGLIVAVVPVALYLLVAVPLVAARERAAAGEVEAREALAWVIERDAAWPTDAGSPANGAGMPGESAPAGLSGIENALSEAGLRDNVEALQNEEGGRISMRLGGIEFVDLGRYLEKVDRSLGYDIASLRIRQSEVEGLVDVDLRIAEEAQ